MSPRLRRHTAATVVSPSSNHACRIERLESRRLLCVAHLAPQAPVELRPDLVGKDLQVNDPADIVWVNRATTTAGGASDTDGFGAQFGTFAPTARGVVDAVILAYERMIGSFNYSLAGQTYNLTLSMGSSGSGFGASASLTGQLGGKPKTGSITMGSGNNDGIANNDNGWFMDPTPNESSEFISTITNGYAADAPSGSPAFNKGDFYTVVAAEMTHCMGLFGSALTMWSSHTTNTGVADTAEGGGIGTFWVFQGPSIKHLLTSNNGGSGGQNFGSAVHGAGPGVNVSFGGDTYTGAQDQGNAVYEFSRRYMINNAFSLMFKDAYAYSSVDPAKWQSAYSILNETTKVATVRGGGASSGTSDDVINITRSGNTITVSVDVGGDIPGTGAFAGAGNLGAFVTEYDISQISSFTVAGGNGNDVFNIAADLGVPVTIDGGTGTGDTVNIIGTSAGETINVTSTGATSGSTTITWSNVEAIGVNAGAGADTVNINSVQSGRPVTVNGGDGDDIVNLVGGVVGTNVTVNGDNNNDTLNLGISFNSPVTFNGGADSDTANFTATDGDNVIAINSTQVTGGNTLNYSNVESLAVNARDGNDTINFDGAGVTAAVSVDGNLGNDTLNINNASGANPVYTATAGSDVVNVNSGTWTVNSDLGSSATQLVALNTVGGNVVLNSDQHLRGLTVATGTSATLSANGGRLLFTRSLAINGTGNLELNDNDFALDYTGASQLSAVETLIRNARNGGDWLGTGLTSAAARNNAAHNTTLGAIEHSDFAGGPFHGDSAIDSTAVIVKYTWYGDANFDGRVTFDDYVRIDTGFNSGLTGWANGDFNYSGGVNFDDYVLIDTAFNTQSGTLGRKTTTATDVPTVPLKPSRGKVGTAKRS